MKKPDSHRNIAIIILAAGESKRMGSPKQLLKWRNTTLLNHSIEQALSSNSDAVFVVLGSNYDKIENSIKTKKVTVLKCDDWKLGMGNSIAFGVNQIRPQGFKGVLVMLADQPQVDTDLLNKLIAEFEKDEQAIIATSYKNGSGVPAIFNGSYFGELGAIYGEKGGKQLINKYLTKVKIITPIKPLLDIDTNEMYLKAKLSR